MNSQEFLTIRGYVQSLPTLPGLDETAKVAVITDNGDEYPVLHKGAGISLIGNINANVEVTGQLFRPAPEDAEADKPECFLSVKSYRLTDGFDDPWYDDAVR
jgi:hypothetical protein